MGLSQPSGGKPWSSSEFSFLRPSANQRTQLSLAIPPKGPPKQKDLPSRPQIVEHAVRHRVSPRLFAILIAYGEGSRVGLGPSRCTKMSRWVCRGIGRGHVAVRGPSRRAYAWFCAAQARRGTAGAQGVARQGSPCSRVSRALEQELKLRGERKAGPWVSRESG